MKSDLYPEYLPDQDLRVRADDFLVEHNPLREIPIPIERIAEFNFGFNVVDIPGLQETIGRVGFLVSPTMEIWVDQFIYNHRINRFRFTIAHELAHWYLHSSIYNESTYSTVTEWKTHHNKIPIDIHKRLEFQADEFAGLVLVPPKELARSFEEKAERVKGASLSIKDDNVKNHICRAIGDEFQVAPTTARIRLEKDGFIEPPAQVYSFGTD